MNIGMFFAAGRLVDTLAHLGEEGWELNAIYDKSSNWLSSMEKGFALFKRPVADGEEPIGPWASTISPVEARQKSAQAASEEQLANEAPEGAVERMQRSLVRQQIVAPGAAEALGPVVTGRPVDGVGRIGADGVQGVIAVSADRAAIWRPGDTAVDEFDLDAIKTVQRRGKLLVLQVADRDALEVLLTSSKAALEWSDYLSRVRRGQ